MPGKRHLIVRPESFINRMVCSVGIILVGEELDKVFLLPHYDVPLYVDLKFLYSVSVG